MLSIQLHMAVALRNSLSRHHRQVPNLLYLWRAGPTCHCIHGTSVCMKTKPDISTEPVKFTSSAANIPSKLKIRDVNENQGIIVVVSLMVFMFYFFYYREENDLDEMLNVPLFERVPTLEEPHLTQAIPLMKERGMDTREAEARLKELVDKRLASEQKQK